LSDIGGYVFGKVIGGKKLTKISPNKTISGSLGSFIFSILPVLLFNLQNYTGVSFEVLSINIALCLIVSLVCQLGDLLISYFKRLNKVKDTGTILPGHGGLLDRIDGLIFAIPTVYILKITQIF
jgi:phosphatidate cytidylyltransferase